jgi:hypothetical protein
VSLDDPGSPYDDKDFTSRKRDSNPEKKGFSMRNILPGNGKNVKDNKNRNGNGHRLLKAPKEDEGDRVLNTLERMYSAKNEQTTDIEEVWFAVRAFSHCIFEGQRLTLSMFCF